MDASSSMPASSNDVSSTTNSVITKRKRTNFTAEESQVLENAWIDDMVTAGAKCLEKMNEVAHRLEIPVEKVKLWIGNRRTKEHLANGNGKKYVKKVKYQRGPSGYSIFASEQRRGDTNSSEFLKQIGAKWQKLDTDTKLGYNKKADEMRSNPTVHRDRERVIKEELDKLRSIVSVLDEQGFVMGGFGIDPKNPHNPGISFYTKTANTYFSSDKFLDFERNFDKREGVCQILKKDVQKKLRTHFQKCWETSTGRKGKISYTAIRENRIKVTVNGLPDGIVFREPHYYGADTCSRLLKLPLKFEISEEEEVPEIDGNVNISTPHLVGVDDVPATDTRLNIDIENLESLPADSHILEAIINPMDNEDETKDTDTSDDIIRLIKKTAGGNKKKKRNRTRLTMKKKTAKPKDTSPSGPSTKTHETRKIQLKDVINQIADDSDDATSIQESDSDEYIPSNEEADTDTSDTENTQNSAEDNVAQNIAVENEIEDRPIVDDERHKKTRKRKSRPNTWKKNQRKNKRTAGESYKSDTTGKEVAEKSLKPCDCSRCRLRCNEKLSEERRTELFQQFYALESWSTQTAYISNAILLSIPRQRTVQNPNQSKKQQTRCYYLSTKTDAGELKSVRVCKRMFMATLDINTARIDYALNKKATGQLVDQRGKHVPGNKTPEEDLVLVRQHIEKFPRYISHYTRQHTKKEYLKGVQNVQDMYRLYKMECDVNNKQAVSQWVYKRVFDFQYNLAFHMPKKDTCKTCDINNIKVQTLTDEAEKAEFMKAWDEHKKLADDVRAKLNANKDKCRNSPGEIKVISFDLQKTKALPHVHTNEAYYKRKLGFYNCGIHDCGPDDGYFRMWHEGTASRGPCEVASCLWHYLSSQEQRGNLPEHLVAYSDSCGGQNRNFTMALFWLSVVHYLPCKVVDHIFMVSGHSFLPSDEDFGLDERQQQKYEHVYTPTEWLLIAKRARRNKKAFDVVEMKKENFVDFKELHNFTTNRKVTENGEKVKWMQIRWLRFEKGVLGSFSFKYSVDPDEDFKVVNVNKQGKGRPSRGYVIRKPDTLHALYPEGREISSGKWNDIQDLLKYVPPVHHGFYNGLRSGRDSLETLSDESEVSGESYDERAQSSL